MAQGKFVAYYRVSSKKQGASGLGLEAQQAAVAAYLNGGNWELVDAFTEVETATKRGNNRPELARAITAAKRNKATLVIAKLDRLARNVAFVSNLMESGIEFVAADMPSANRLTIHILAAVAEAEAAAISKRTKEALAAAKARGVKLGKPENLDNEARRRGSPKGGAKMREQACLEYAQILPTIKAMHERSLREIAAYLNQAGERTRNNKPFTAMTVKRIIDRQS